MSLNVSGDGSHAGAGRKLVFQGEVTGGGRVTEQEKKRKHSFTLPLLPDPTKKLLTSLSNQ